ncbi:MAG: riboflavin synthase [Gemmatimonadetes bacterium]|nr:riboflavin synthase [Gemmatimonadota bacterium]
MFTGLITDTGTIDRVRTTDAGREFRIQCAYEAVRDGESIAVNGACLTVRECGAGWFTVAAVVTTLDRTTIAAWTEGKRVNLERALAVGDRLGGHLVQGHVDGVATVRVVTQRGDATLIDIEVPAELMPLTVPHGSITVDGVSLTVNAIPQERVVQLSIIEYTLRHTTLGALALGDSVHVEADVIGKFVQRLTAPHLAAAAER